MAKLREGGGSRLRRGGKTSTALAVAAAVLRAGWLTSSGNSGCAAASHFLPVVNEPSSADGETWGDDKMRQAGIETVSALEEGGARVDPMKGREEVMGKAWRGMDESNGSNLAYYGEERGDVADEDAVAAGPVKLSTQDYVASSTKNDGGSISIISPKMDVTKERSGTAPATSPRLRSSAHTQKKLQRQAADVPRLAANPQDTQARRDLRKKLHRKKRGRGRKSGKSKASKSKTSTAVSGSTKGPKTSGGNCTMEKFLGQWIYMAPSCQASVYVDVHCEHNSRGPCYFYEVHSDGDLCAFGTDDGQAFDPWISLGPDDDGACTLGLHEPIHLTQYHEGRDKCDSENPRELSVKMREGADGEEMIIDFSDDQGVTYYTESEDDESRVASRMSEWRRSRDLATLGERDDRHLISEAEQCILEFAVRRRLECADPAVESCLSVYDIFEGLNSDNSLDYNEVKRTLVVHGLTKSMIDEDAGVHELFDPVDEDGDGRISFEELVSSDAGKQLVLLAQEENCDFVPSLPDQTWVNRNAGTLNKMRDIFITAIGIAVSWKVAAETGGGITDLVSCVDDKKMDLCQGYVGQATEVILNYLVPEAPDKEDPTASTLKQFIPWVTGQLNFLKRYNEKVAIENMFGQFKSEVAGALRQEKRLHDIAKRFAASFPVNVTAETYPPDISSWADEERDAYGEWLIHLSCDPKGPCVDEKLESAMSKCTVLTSALDDSMIRGIKAERGSSDYIISVWPHIAGMGGFCIALSEKYWKFYEVTYNKPRSSKEYHSGEYYVHLRGWISHAGDAVKEVLKWRNAGITTSVGSGSVTKGCNPWCLYLCQRTWYYTEFVIQDGSDDKCSRPTEVGALGTVGKHTPGSEKLECGYNDRYHIDGEYGAFVRGGAVKAFKNVVIRGFEDTVLGSWGNDIMKLWRYQTYEWLEKGVKPHLVKQLRVSPMLSGRSWNVVQGKVLHSGSVGRFDDPASLRIEFPCCDYTHIEFPSLGSSSLYWKFGSIINWIGGVRGYVGRPNFVSMTRFRGTGPTQGGTYSCFTHFYHKQDMTAIATITSEFDQDRNFVFQHPPEYYKNIFGYNWNRQSQDIVDDTSFPGLGDPRWQVAPARVGDMGCLVSLEAFWDERSAGKGGQMLNLVPVWQVHNYEPMVEAHMDTYIRDRESADSNFGSTGSLWVAKAEDAKYGNNYITLLKFKLLDKSDISLKRAVLKLYLLELFEIPSLSVRRIDSDFFAEEDQPTWNNAYGFLIADSVKAKNSLMVSSNNLRQWVEVDITDLVSLDGSEITLAVQNEGPDGLNWAEFASKEYPTLGDPLQGDHAPKLIFYEKPDSEVILPEIY